MIDSKLKLNLKRTFLAASAAVLAFLSSEFKVSAQGTLSFSSADSPVPCITSNVITGTTAKVAVGQFMFGLYVGTTTNAMLLSTTPLILVTNIPGIPGSISGKSLTLNQFAPGTTLVFQVKGWSLFSSESPNGVVLTFDQALAYSMYVGSSQIGATTLGGGATLPGFVFGSTGGRVLSPVLTNSPEPSTVLLGGKGIAALAFMRCPKA